MKNTTPLVSFTFDDVPKSACTRGRQILEDSGSRGTFYLSLSLMDSDYSIGSAFSRIDLERLIAGGHEIGSHTFGHLDAWATRADLFEASILENQRRLSEISPGQVFRTFSYPLMTPHPRIKRTAGALHVCCRGGGQATNAKTVDLNLLNSYFIDARNRGDLDAMKRLLDESCAATGWLIFSTHDIDERPSPYGCAPGLFEDLVRYARGSGAEVLPVYDAWARLAGDP
jgi:peptidoglycan/xylan/chitin deacetylase (PgdA/CDA1 family)